MESNTKIVETILYSTRPQFIECIEFPEEFKRKSKKKKFKKIFVFVFLKHNPDIVSNKKRRKRILEQEAKFKKLMLENDNIIDDELFL